MGIKGSQSLLTFEVNSRCTVSGASFPLANRGLTPYHFIISWNEWMTFGKNSPIMREMDFIYAMPPFLQDV